MSVTPKTPLPSSSPRFAPGAREALALAVAVARGVLGGAVVGVLCGASSAVFLQSLAWATATQAAHPALLFLLPLAGLAVGLAYHVWGGPVEGGNNLLLERIHSEAQIEHGVPFRLAPLVFMGTVITHLFGGSAGREGTAVQMGGALASLVSRPFRLTARDHRVLLMSGVSGGFGAVFGTPLAGAVFGMEAQTVGRVSYDGIIPCFVASVVGDITCRALGMTHHVYQIAAPMPALTLGVWGVIALLGVLCGLTSLAFVELTEAVAHGVKRLISKYPYLRPAVGGVVVIALTFLVGSRDYLGLSLPLLERAFTLGDIVLWAWALKLLFTAVTLGTGFKGGEVTPLFVIGATLGAAVAHVAGVPVGFFAALGFVAVFAGAANTPLTCVLLGVELFGAPIGVPVFAVVVLAYIASGHRGIYPSQRIAVAKAHSITLAENAVLRDVRSKRDSAAPPQKNPNGATPPL